MTKVRNDSSNTLVRIVTAKTLLENVMIIILQAKFNQLKPMSLMGYNQAKKE